jgi:G3E family GTPase
MFLTQHAAQRRLPVVLLSGFLGSGKTTLVNALLRDPRLADTAVAINEFGEVPLDQLLIEHGEDRTVVLANGCLCCRLAGDFEDAVMRVFSRRQSGELPRFARLLIEPSGLADPAPIAQAIMRNPVMAGALRLEAIIATVDAVLVESQLARYPETRKQIALADQLVVTKTDMVDAAALAQVTLQLRRFNPVAPIHTAVLGKVDAAALLPAGFIDPTDAAAARHARTGLLAEHVTAPAAAEHDDATTAVSLFADAPLAWRAFDAWLRRLRIAHAKDLLRIKGMVDIAGTSGPVVIQCVEHVMHAPLVLDHWPTAGRRSQLVVISRGLDPASIRALWSEALPGLVALPNLGATPDLSAATVH